jgi:uncharacterized membrane protein
MKRIIIIMLVIITGRIYCEGDYEKGKIIKVLQKVEANQWEEELDYKQMYKVKIESGKDKGKIINIEMPFYKEEAYNLKLKNKVEVMLYRDVDENIYYIVDRVRSKSVFSLIALFVVIVLVIARFKGFKSLLSLAVTVLFLFYVFIPMISRGFSPIIAAMILCIFSSLVTVFAIDSFSKKSLCALLGTLGGVIFSSIVSIIFVKLTGLTGYIDSDTMNYSFIFKDIDLLQLISAGIIIGSLGATMDIGVSISSALFEIDSHTDNLTRLKVFKSGINIGRDVIGTMVNTLILAYLGSSILTIILFLNQRADFPLIRIINSEFIVVEILRAFSGSIGILLAVPITSYIASLIIPTKKND